MNLKTESLPPVRTIDGLEALRVVSDSQRHRILSALIAEPLAASDLAERLKLPRTRIYYHLELLERHGFIRLAGYRDEGATERVYRATAAAFHVDRSLLGSRSTSLNDARAELLEAAAHDLRAAAASQSDEAFVQRGFVRVPAGELSAFRAELVGVVEKYADRRMDGDEIEVVVALFGTAAQ
ncbi:MAG TPA: winged helix-turn-helix domain-containing protein [Candidatus Elarobacter sp.]|jgi:DNA-binding transcriptional ArsR family regulator|nr:winged helix-turn-helix domain-containing protein [Candidatus Elarobacter sp.]